MERAHIIPHAAICTFFKQSDAHRERTLPDQNSLVLPATVHKALNSGQAKFAEFNPGGEVSKFRVVPATDVDEGTKDLIDVELAVEQLHDANDERQRQELVTHRSKVGFISAEKYDGKMLELMRTLPTRNGSSLKGSVWSMSVLGVDPSVELLLDLHGICAMAPTAAGNMIRNSVMARLGALEKELEHDSVGGTSGTLESGDG